MPRRDPSEYQIPVRQIVRAMLVSYIAQADQIEWPPAETLERLLARSEQVALTIRNTLGDRMVPYTRLDIKTAYVEYGAPESWGFEAMVWIELPPVRGWYWIEGDERL